MNVDIWSDLVCPWCYIGERNFETALAGFAHRAHVEVRRHSFELDPNGSTEPRLTLPDRHRLDLGVTVEQTKRNMAMVAEQAAAAGLTYDLARAIPVNSFDAHRVLKLGERAGVGERVRTRLMGAYTSEGEILSDHETLVRLGAECGLDPEEIRTMLKDTDLCDEVRDDEKEARALGISGVPTFVVAGRYAVSGGRPPAAFAEALERSWRETAPDATEGGVCGTAGTC
ncbi:putative DsbA family dithiol-disulfide isomerase [Lipingzhangella halophila]|uniref:Putative DsbA family dithiol-disulfide isomerase n=1 Tax=Lipingzhangella halophila TaxID=1783352 RepID=A0A7W7RFE2_9ACTN|nr:DsbA family oxidoreductase [Lipingzhangella halophila]MBB4931009.1 putative DsbA family dithiol-disulfide isomerase [Lipingzhangella halophila]